MSRNAAIRFEVELNKENIPRAIRWEASDAPFEGTQPCDALLLSLWDPEARETLSINLWTSGMRVDDMSFHVVHSMMRLADSFRRATQNHELADSIERFARDLGTKVKAHFSKSSA